MTAAGKNIRPTVLLFDLDGTLVDTAPDLIAATNALRSEHGLAALDTARVRTEVSQGGWALARMALGEDASRDDLERLLGLYAERLGQSSQLFDGLGTFIEELEKAGIGWGIVTNKERRFAEPLLACLHIAPPVLVCGDDVTHSKPAPDALLKAATALQAPVEQAVYVGDHQRDILAAHNAGMTAIAAGFGYSSADDKASDWGAELTVATPKALVEALHRIMFSSSSEYGSGPLVRHQ